MRNHTLSCRVYYEDTDAGGIMYHAGYLRFAERARTEWLRGLGMNQQEFRETTGLGFVVTRVVIDYLMPARLDDTLDVTTALTDLGRASLKLTQEIRRGTSVLATLAVIVACIDAAGQVARLPEALYNTLQA